MKNLLTTTMLMIAGLSFAQSSSQMQYAAYLKASKTMWERSILLAEKESGARSFEKAVAMYGLLNNTMATQDEETFNDNVDQTVDLLKEIIESDPENGEPKAVLSSVYGLIMAYSPMKGMFYGMKSSSLMQEAIRKSPDSPLVQKLEGGSKLYTPEMFGGDADKAVEAFERSIALFEAAGDKENWLYSDTFMGLAMAYQKLGKTEEAMATLEKAVAMEPEFHWAKSVLAEMKKS